MVTTDTPCLDFDSITGVSDSLASTSGPTLSCYREETEAQAGQLLLNSSSY